MLLTNALSGWAMEFKIKGAATTNLLKIGDTFAIASDTNGAIVAIVSAPDDPQSNTPAGDNSHPISTYECTAAEWLSAFPATAPTQQALTNSIEPVSGSGKCTKVDNKWYAGLSAW